MPVLVAIITPKPGKLDEAAELFTRVIPMVHDEPGCELYSLHRNADKLVMIEKWTDEDALDKHRRAPSLAEIGARMGDLFDEPMQVLVVDAVPAGDPAKGAL